MRRTDRMVIRDPACHAIQVRRATFPSDEDRAAGADLVLGTLESTPGLLRYSVYRGLEEPTLLELSQWSDRASRDYYAEEAHASTRARLRNVTHDWRHLCDDPHRTFVRESEHAARCLVVVRQPLRRADPKVAREWIDAVVGALEGQAPEGLCAATFFVSVAGDVVLNFAEWTSAEAHRTALNKADFGQYGSIGDTQAWRAVRAHPAITPDHEVRRYELVSALEP